MPTAVSALPHLKTDHPKSRLSPNMESLEQLSTKYNNCPIYKSVDAFLEDFDSRNRSNTKETKKKNIVDGAIVCTPHHTHHDIGKLLLDKDIHIFMEKPMTTNVAQARALHELYQQKLKQKQQNPCCFMINHSANYRHQAKMVHDLISIRKNAIYLHLWLRHCRLCLIILPMFVGQRPLHLI